MPGYFEEAKKKLEIAIPDYDSSDFKRLRNEIKKQLKKKENDLFIQHRRLKILVLGDWYNEEKNKTLRNIKTFC